MTQRNNDPNSQNSILCTKCGREFKPSELFCRECGTPKAVAGGRCPKCGAAVHEGQEFCPYCGVKTVYDRVTAAVTTPASKNTNASVSGKRKPLAIILVAVLLVVILMVVLVCKLGTRVIYDGEYDVVRESVRLSNSDYYDSYEADTEGIHVTISGLDDTKGESGVITLNRDGDIYTGIMEKDESSDSDLFYNVTWDDDNVPEVTKNPYGYSAGSLNMNHTFFYVKEDATILNVNWTYNHLIYGDSDDGHYFGSDWYYLEKE